MLSTLLLTLTLLVPQASLTSPSPKERQAAIADLAVLGNKDGIAPLAEALKKESRKDLRIEMIRALTTIRDNAVLPILAESLSADPEGEVRLDAADAFLRFYIPMEQQSRLQSFLGRVKGVFLERDRPLIDHSTTVDPLVTAALAEALRKDFSAPVRLEAARVLGSLRATSQIPAMIEVLEDPRNRQQTPVRLEIIKSLGAIRDVAAGPALARVLQERNTDLLGAAIESIGLVGYAEARPALEETFHSNSNTAIKQRALAALSLIRSAESVPLFVSLLDHRSDVFREVAAEGLARQKHDISVFESRITTEKKDNVRVAQFYGIAAAGKAERIADLVGALATPQNEQASIYLYELGKFNGLLPEIHRYVGVENAVMRARLVAVLGRIGDASSAPHIEALTKDPDVNVAREAVNAMRVMSRNP